MGPDDQLRVQNFHFPLRYEKNASATNTTYNGYVVKAQNAVELPIPALADGWNDLEPKTTRCKNFQFAVAYFGYPASVPVVEHR